MQGEGWEARDNKAHRILNVAAGFGDEMSASLPGVWGGTVAQDKAYALHKEEVHNNNTKTSKEEELNWNWERASFHGRERLRASCKSRPLPRHSAGGDRYRCFCARFLVQGGLPPPIRELGHTPWTGKNARLGVWKERVWCGDVC